MRPEYDGIVIFIIAVSMIALLAGFGIPAAHRERDRAAEIQQETCPCVCPQGESK